MGIHTLVVAHRGYAPASIHQNSLEAFKLAERYGAKAIEFDIRMTKDHELVIFHDPFYWNGNGFRRVPSVTLDEFRETFDNNRAPTFSSLCKEIDRRIKFFIELKPTPFPDRLIKILESHIPTDREILILTYKQHILKKLNQTGLPSGLHYINPFKDNIARAKKYGAIALSPIYWVVNSTTVKKIQNSGLEIYPWTVNKPVFIKTLIDWGVDGIYTNNFPVAKTLLETSDSLGKQMLQNSAVYNTR
ncbi:MAG: hypothetical protein D6732_20685 [Methanobacteriota archaeon]|nr:MAG: hypothetical protein D6732_20685 [Euryarchaeota archaeon]